MRAISDGLYHCLDPNPHYYFNEPGGSGYLARLNFDGDTLLVGEGLSADPRNPINIYTHFILHTPYFYSYVAHFKMGHSKWYRDDYHPNGVIDFSQSTCVISDVLADPHGFDKFKVELRKNIDRIKRFDIVGSVLVSDFGWKSLGSGSFLKNVCGRDVLVSFHLNDNSSRFKFNLYAFYKYDVTKKLRSGCTNHTITDLNTGCISVIGHDGDQKHYNEGWRLHKCAGRETVVRILESLSCLVECFADSLPTLA